jgi:hypothetical protein
VAPSLAVPRSRRAALIARRDFAAFAARRGVPVRARAPGAARHVAQFVVRFVRARAAGGGCSPFECEGRRPTGAEVPAQRWQRQALPSVLLPPEDASANVTTRERRPAREPMPTVRRRCSGAAYGSRRAAGPFQSGSGGPAAREWTGVRHERRVISVQPRRGRYLGVLGDRGDGSRSAGLVTEGARQYGCSGGQSAASYGAPAGWRGEHVEEWGAGGSAGSSTGRRRPGCGSGAGSARVSSRRRLADYVVKGAASEMGSACASASFGSVPRITVIRKRLFRPTGCPRSGLLERDRTRQGPDVCADEVRVALPVPRRVPER